MRNTFDNDRLGVYDTRTKPRMRVAQDTACKNWNLEHKNDQDSPNLYCCLPLHAVNLKVQLFVIRVAIVPPSGIPF